MKVAYELYAEVVRSGGHIYIKAGMLCAGPASAITEDLRTSIIANRENVRSIASVLQESINFKLEEMVDEVFTNDEARFCGDPLPPERLLSFEEIKRRLERGPKPPVRLSQDLK